MFKTKTAKGEETRARILESALRLFRERGLDVTTMREVAAEADMSLGAAYHYFPGKEAIVLAYYEQVQEEHRARVERALADQTRPFKERVAIAMHTKLDVLENDRKLLGALFRYTGDPRHPLSFLGEGTRRHRQESIAVFEQVVGDELIPRDVAHLLPLALWTLHMGIMLYFLYDDSPGARRTRKLVDGSVDLVVRLIALNRIPIMKPLRRRLLALLEEAQLGPRRSALGGEN